MQSQYAPQAFQRQFSFRHKAQPIDRNPLPGAARYEFRRKILDDTKVKASTRVVLDSLLDDFCWGRADCFPSNHAIAAKTNVHVRHVRRILRRLEDRGVISCVVDLSIWSRRRIVILAHPHAPKVLDELRKSPFLVARNLGLTASLDTGVADGCEGDISCTCEGDKLPPESSNAFVPHEKHDNTRTSSSEVSLETTSTQPEPPARPPLPVILDPIPTISDAEMDELAAVAAKVLPDPAVAKPKITAAHKKLAPVAQEHGHSLDAEWIRAAIEVTQKKGKGWGYTIGILQNWTVEGFAPPAKPKTPPAPCKPHVHGAMSSGPIPPPAGFGNWQEWIAAGCPS